MFCSSRKPKTKNLTGGRESQKTQITMKQPLRLCLNSHDEVFFIDLERVLYFESDDHYSHVFYNQGKSFLLPYGLGHVETQLTAMGPDADFLLRMGRKLIVNSHRIFKVNTAKEQLFLTDDQGNSVVLHVPKAVLRTWVNDFNLD